MQLGKKNGKKKGNKKEVENGSVIITIIRLKKISKVEKEIVHEDNQYNDYWINKFAESIYSC